MSKLKNEKIKNGVKTHPKIEDRKLLQDSILQLTEQKVSDGFSDKQLDRENEKITLLRGTKVNIPKVLEFISHIESEYDPMFRAPFYAEIYRLNKWDLDPKVYSKPPIVGTWTNELIYGRFPKDVLISLQILNPFISGTYRKHKHFQYLNKEGKALASQYIEECISIMKKCNSWYEFRRKYYSEVGVGYQLDVFKEAKS